MNNFNYIPFPGFSTRCTQDSSQGLSISALFAYNFSHIRFCRSEIQHGSVVTFNFSNRYNAKRKGWSKETTPNGAE